MSPMSGMVITGVCFFANTYMAASAITSWTKTAAILMATVSLLLFAMHVIRATY